jgi:ubiquinone/menaquinone biosynthesis C-methylase UbiE
VSHPDPFREVDRSANPSALAAALEARGRATSQRRLRLRFLRSIPVRRGDTVLEVGCGTGVILRDLVPVVGRGGRLAGVDPSRTLLAAARRLCRGSGVTLRAGDGAKLPFADDGFDVTLAVTVLLHVADAAGVVREMARVTRAGGRVAVQDQDFGTLAVTHPDRALTARILDGVVDRVYEEPHSGRRLPELLREAGLERVRLATDVYQDTALEPYTRTFLERRAELAVRFEIVEAPVAQRWLDGFTDLVRRGTFVFTINYYGAVGVKPRAQRHA